MVKSLHDHLKVPSRLQTRVKNINSFLVQALGRMKQNNQLFITLYRSIIAEFHKLTTEQMALLLWCMVKGQQNDKNTVLAIYKKLHKILRNDQKIKLYKQGEDLPFNYSQNSDINEQQPQSVHHMHESSFVQLIWAIQKTKIIDEKLILDILKQTFKDQEFKNLQKVRIENLCLLAYCMQEMKLQKYKISQTIINKIMQSWEQLQKLSMLSLVLLCRSFSKFVYYQQEFLKKYSKDLTPEEIAKKQQYLSKERRFIFLIVETIFLRQNRSTKFHKQPKKKTRKQNQEDQQIQLVKLKYSLSSKFASQIIFQLGKLNLYDRNIWYKLLSSITEDVDQAEIQDLSMALTGICNLNSKEIPSQDNKNVIYPQKKILCRRVFQIYNSLTGRSLKNIKELVYEKKIQNQFVPSRIRREIQQQFVALKTQKQAKEEYSSQMKNKAKKHQKTSLEENQNLDEQQQQNTSDAENTQTKNLRKRQKSQKKNVRPRRQEKTTQSQSQIIQ